jgi:hypothetical protein
MTTRFRSALIVGLLAAVTLAATGQMRTNKLGVGIYGSIYDLSGDVKEKAMKMGGGLSVSYAPWQYVGIRANAGVGQFGYTLPAGTTMADASLLAAATPGVTNFATINGSLSFHLMPNSKFNPFLSGGAGYIIFDPRTEKGAPITGAGIPRTDFNYFGGGGFDYFFSEFFSVTLMGEMVLSGTDRFEGIAGGSSKSDSYLRGTIEFRYYFFDKAFMARMLEALKARYE